MKGACLLAAAFVCTSIVQGATLERHKRQAKPGSGVCGTGETLIISRKIQTKAFTKCPIDTLVSRYFEPFVTECEHWMGSKPDHVASSRAFHCLEKKADKSVEIRATICCKGKAPANRCLQCTSDDPYECDYSAGAVVTCAAGEQCQTQKICNAGARKATIIKSCVKTCASSTSCLRKTYLEHSESCTDCCDTTFCNANGNGLSCYTNDCDCPKMETGKYHCGTGGKCLCNDGCSGDRCQTCIVTCNPNPCNGHGQCRMNSNQVSCCCDPGYDGPRCEIKLSENTKCARSDCSNHGDCVTEGSGTKRCKCDAGYYGASCSNISSAFWCPNSKDIYYSNPAPENGNCNNIVNKALSKTSELGACRFHMRTKYNTPELFVNGQNGIVTELTSVGVNVCNEGACGRVHYQTKTCCPSCYSNPCQNRGYCLQTNRPKDGKDYVCRCGFGFSGKYCEKTVKTCFVFGEPHFKTLDGLPFTYHGDPQCRSILSHFKGNQPSLPAFTVYLKTEYRIADRSVTYPKYMEIQVHNYTIRFDRNNVVTVKKPRAKNFKVISLNADYPKVGLAISTVGRFVRLETEFGLVAQYDGYNMMFLQVPSSYSGLLSGICNNMDDDVNNDLKDCEGVTRANTPTGWTQYGDSCVDPDDVTDQTKCKSPVPLSCNADQYGTNAHCGQLVNTQGPFKTCVEGLTDKIMFESCKYDVCRDRNAKCNAMESFVRTCASKGFSPERDWRKVTGCPMKCPTNSHYEFSGSACQPTCEDLHAAQNCSQAPTEVCVCNGDMVLQDDTCTTLKDCGCKDSDNIRHKVGEIWDKDDRRCSHNKCVAPNRFVAEKSQPTNGGWGDWGTWSVCDERTNTEKRTRQCDKPTPECGGRNCVGSKESTRACPIDETTTPKSPTTLSPPPCAPNFNYAKACAECDSRNPLLYVANPCGCETYFQCFKNGRGYDIKTRPCAPCTCWDQSKLTCVHKDSAKCRQQRPVNERIDRRGGECSRSGVTKVGAYRYRAKAVPGDRTVYIRIISNYWSIRRACPSGTVFNLDSCGCIHGLNKKPMKEFMCLTFDKGFETTTGVYVSPSNYGLELVTPGVERSNSRRTHFALRCKGGNVEIPAFKNKELRQFTMTLWYKESASKRPAKAQALVSNDDCLNAKSYLRVMSYSATEIRAGVQTTHTQLGDVFKHNLPADGRWHHVAMTFGLNPGTGAATVKFYLDGKRVQTASARGHIPGAHCPLRLCSGYKKEFFYGLIDQVCFYDQVLEEDQIATSYKKYAVGKATADLPR